FQHGQRLTAHLYFLFVSQKNLLCLIFFWTFTDQIYAGLLIEFPVFGNSVLDSHRVQIWFSPVRNQLIMFLSICQKLSRILPFVILIIRPPAAQKGHNQSPSILLPG